MSTRLLHLAEVPAATPKLAITIDLDQLRQRMAQFVAAVAPDDPTAYTIPFETYLQWELRQRQEHGHADQV